MSKQPVLLSLTNVMRRRARFSLEASVRIERGEVVLVTGANGSGKTTLLRMLAGVGRDDSGSRTVDGSVCFVPTGVVFDPSLRTKDVMCFSTDADQARALLEAFGFRGDFDARFGTLSFGNARKLVYAIALNRQSTITIIDELPAGIDTEGLAAIRAALAERALSGASVVVADQESVDAVNCARVLFVHDGTVEEQPPEMALTQSQVTLSGPAGRLNELLVSARAAGYKQVGEQ